MKKTLIFACIGITLLVTLFYALPYLAGWILFNNKHIEKDKITYNELVETLSELNAVYRFKTDVLKGCGPYYVMFDKGMDHTCIVRVDNAESVIIDLKNKKYKYSFGIQGGIGYDSLPWRYERFGPQEYGRYSIDEYNYYLVDESKNIVWYVQFST